MDRELSRKHGAILYPKCANNGKGAFCLANLESTNGSYMRLIGPYSQKGIGTLTVGGEFIISRTGFSVNRFNCGMSEAIGAKPIMEDHTIVIQNLLYCTHPLNTTTIATPRTYSRSSPLPPSMLSLTDTEATSAPTTS